MSYPIGFRLKANSSSQYHKGDEGICLQVLPQDDGGEDVYRVQLDNGEFRQLLASKWDNVAPAKPKVFGNTIEAPSSVGAKYDGGKPRWYMLMGLCAKALKGVMEVLEFGAKKYAPGSWAEVPNAEQRYKDALYRHLHEIELGNDRDEESGLLHYDHIATNALFLSQLAHAKPTSEPGEQLKLPL